MITELPVRLKGMKVGCRVKIRAASGDLVIGTVESIHFPKAHEVGRPGIGWVDKKGMGRWAYMDHVEKLVRCGRKR